MQPCVSGFSNQKANMGLIKRFDEHGMIIREATKKDVIVQRLRSHLEAERHSPQSSRWFKTAAEGNKGLPIGSGGVGQNKSAYFQPMDFQAEENVCPFLAWFKGPSVTQFLSGVPKQSLNLALRKNARSCSGIHFRRYGCIVSTSPSIWKYVPLIRLTDAILHCLCLSQLHFATEQAARPTPFFNVAGIHKRWCRISVVPTCLQARVLKLPMCNGEREGFVGQQYQHPYLRMTRQNMIKKNGIPKSIESRHSGSETRVKGACVNASNPHS